MPDTVYVLSNDSYSPDLRKIGFTAGALQQRLSQLNTTGVPNPFRVDYWCEVTRGKGHSIERDVHRKLAAYRNHGSREFFRITVSAAVEVIRSCAGGAFEREWLASDTIEKSRAIRKEKNMRRGREICMSLDELRQEYEALIERSISVNPFKAKQREQAKHEATKTLELICALEAELEKIAEEDEIG